MAKKIVKLINDDSERGARHQLMEELFNDFHSSRHQVYWMNFTRGLFFGFGTLLGGTVLAAVLIWTLGQFDSIPYIGDYIRNIINTMK